MKHLGDITKLSGFEVPPVDCVTGGSPCQDLSVAGKRAGLAGERSGLFMEQIRLIKEMREHDRNIGRSGWAIRPRYMVWENVLGALSSNKGEDFRAVIEETIHIVDKDAVIPGPPKEGWHKSGVIVGDGWSIAWRCHDSQFHGVPQRRKRICLLADFNGDAAPRILFDPQLWRISEDPKPYEIISDSGEKSRSKVQPKCKGLQGNPKQGGETREGSAEGIREGTNSASKCLNALDAQSKRIQSVYCLQGGGETSQNSQGSNINKDVSFTLNAMDRHGVVYGIEPGAAQRMNPENRISEELSPTLRSNMGDNQVAVAYKNDDSFTAVYRGDSITSPVNASNPQNGDPCHTLTGDNRNYLIQTASFDHGQGSGAYSLGYAVELAGTVEAGKTKSVLTAVGVDAYNQTTTGDVSMAMTAERSDPQHIPCVCMDVFHLDSDEETALTLKQRDYKDPHVVLEAKTVMGEDITPTFVSRMSSSVGNTQDEMNVVTYQNTSCSLMASGYDKLGTQEAANDMYVTPNSIVRRLTPMEAERLQGFPDGWTDIGDWVDSKGKVHKTSDSNRYKALGNSIATPFWFWLLRRISAQYERPATLGSLFDGIGGFPYCWEKCNGKGTAIWASEIEEFPIAVTKIHFPEKEEENNV